MNIKEAREALAILAAQDVWNEAEDAYYLLDEFIGKVEHLLANNSIKQVPALLRKDS